MLFTESKTHRPPKEGDVFLAFELVFSTRSTFGARTGFIHPYVATV